MPRQIKPSCEVLYLIAFRVKKKIIFIQISKELSSGHIFNTSRYVCTCAFGIKELLPSFQLTLRARQDKAMANQFTSMRSILW